MRMRAFLGAAVVATSVGLTPAWAQKSADTLRIAWRDAIPNVDFYYNSQRTGLIVSHQVWDTLVYRDPETFALKPQLATSWRNVDDTTIEFELRPNVKFQDGSTFTADDVVYTVNLVLTDKQLAVPSNYTWIAGATKVDDFHVQIKLKRVFPAALEYLAMVLPIYPKTYRERVGADFSQHPIGTGPYTITKVDGVTEIDLVRNDDYFEGPKGKPLIKNLVIKEVADATGELTQLLSGQADWVWNVSSDQFAEARGDAESADRDQREHARRLHDGRRGRAERKEPVERREGAAGDPLRIGPADDGQAVHATGLPRVGYAVLPDAVRL